MRAKVADRYKSAWAGLSASEDIPDFDKHPLTGDCDIRGSMGFSEMRAPFFAGGKHATKTMKKMTGFSAVSCEHPGTVHVYYHVAGDGWKKAEVKALKPKVPPCLTLDQMMWMESRLIWR